jgi:hypothetical protein
MARVERSDDGYVSYGERECRRVLEELFPNNPFARVRPFWLEYTYPGRRTPPQPLELDLYSDELKLAIEYNGEQHYRYVEAIHGPGDSGRKKFWAQQRRDHAKQVLCSKRAVDLVIVPYHTPSIRAFLSNHPTIQRKTIIPELRELDALPPSAPSSERTSFSPTILPSK